MNNQPNDSLPQRLKETAAFFEPENLAKLLLKYEGEVALLVIDVQKKYCDPTAWPVQGTPETVAVSERIESLVPEFRKAGIPVYVVYYSGKREKNPDKIDFYKFSPCEGDTLIPKNKPSAFAGSNIRDILEKDHKKLLLTCGFNQAGCVMQTDLDARKAGFEVCLLQDLAGNDNKTHFYVNIATRDMRDAGVVMTTSEEVLKHLRAPRP